VSPAAAAAAGGGLESRRAWGIVAAAFATCFVAFGIAYSYGAFVEELRAEFRAGRAVTAALFAATSFAWFGLSWATGAAADRFGPRRVLMTGAVLIGLGLVVTARAGSLGVALAGYGIGVGVGVACLYVPLVTLVAAWFDRRRTTAIGVAVAGIGLGTLVVPPVSALLIEAIGWRDAYLVLAAAGTPVLVACAWTARPAPREPASGGGRLKEVARTADYRWLTLSALLVTTALFVPFVHLPPYAQERGASPVMAAALLSVIGLASIVGRLALGALASAAGLLRTYQGCFAVVALSFAIWWAAGDSYPALVVFAVALGTSYGGFVALCPAVVAERFGVDRLGSLLGLLYTGAGLGSALGPPAAGAAIDAAGHDAAIAGSLMISVLAFAALLPVGRRTRTQMRHPPSVG
jgi:MFS family permease